MLIDIDRAREDPTLATLGESRLERYVAIAGELLRQHFVFDEDPEVDEPVQQACVELVRAIADPRGLGLAVTGHAIGADAVSGTPVVRGALPLPVLTLMAAYPIRPRELEPPAVVNEPRRLRAISMTDRRATFAGQHWTELNGS
jgi:hypothetical protein